MIETPYRKPLPIERGKPGPDPLAHVLVSKYADLLPLYRQAEIHAHEGADLERSPIGPDGRRHSSILS